MDYSLAFRASLAVVAAYLFCGIPWSLIIGKAFYGVDLRECGSGNLGATNVYRTLGVWAAILTAVLDVAKGAVAILFAMLLVPASHFGPQAQAWVQVLAVLAAIAGHSYSPYIGFKGGKGVATAAGCLVVMTPYPIPFLVGTFVLVIVLTRTVSMASLAVAFEYPVLCVIFYPGDWLTIGFAVVAAGLVIWRHRANIVRIAHGEEPKIRMGRARLGHEDIDIGERGHS
jgi:acyl phosphate:glycerol-3-phosphate acyltransferase